MTLMKDYDNFIKEGNGAIEIKFFTLPYHINFIMIGNERMFSAPILHSIIGRELPCFELFPTGDNSLFHKFQRDFEYIFCNNNPAMVIPLKSCKELYEASGFSLDKIREIFSKKISQLQCV